MLSHLPKVGIVIPCYEEAKRLPAKDFLDFSKRCPGILLLFVNDGSLDETLEVLNKLALESKGNIQALDLKKNFGKAEAVRQGINHLLNISGIQNVGFLDADLSTPLSCFEELLEYMAGHKELKMISGSRIKRMGATITRSTLRHYLSRIVATIAGFMIVRIPVYDTQCGAKVFTAQLAKLLFQDRFISKWFFDIELYCRMVESLGYDEVLNTVYELPLKEWKHVGNSKLTFKQMVSVSLDMLRIYFKYSLKRRYGQQVTAREGL